VAGVPCRADAPRGPGARPTRAPARPQAVVEQSHHARHAPAHDLGAGELGRVRIPRHALHGRADGHRHAAGAPPAPAAAPACRQARLLGAVSLLLAGAPSGPSACSCGVVAVRGEQAAALLAALLAHIGKHGIRCGGEALP